MPKKYEVSYILKFHVEAENENEGKRLGHEALFDFLSNIGHSPYLGFREITELEE